MLSKNCFCKTSKLLSHQKKQFKVELPNVVWFFGVISYNSGMGEVDLADAKRKVYTCSRRSKKWWTRLFYFVGCVHSEFT